MPDWFPKASGARRRSEIPDEPVAWRSRRPQHAPRRSEQNGPVAAIAFLFVAAVMLGALYYGYRWATNFQDGLLSTAVGDATGLLATPTETLPLGLATPTTAATGEAQAAGTPQPADAPEATPTPAQRIHVVQAGDNPAKLALRYGVSADAIMQANNITDPHRLHIGQELIIPGPSGTDAATPTATPGP